MDASVTKEEAQELREKLDVLKRDLADVARLAKDKVVGGTVQWTKEHPATAVGIIAGVAAAVGFGLGLIVGRNRS